MDGRDVCFKSLIYIISASDRWSSLPYLNSGLNIHALVFRERKYLTIERTLGLQRLRMRSPSESRRSILPIREKLDSSQVLIWLQVDRLHGMTRRTNFPRRACRSIDPEPRLWLQIEKGGVYTIRKWKDDWRLVTIRDIILIWSRTLQRSPRDETLIRQIECRLFSNLEKFWLVNTRGDRRFGRSALHPLSTNSNSRTPQFPPPFPSSISDPLYQENHNLHSNHTTFIV